MKVNYTETIDKVVDIKPVEIIACAADAFEKHNDLELRWLDAENMICQNGKYGLECLFKASPRQIDAFKIIKLIKEYKSTYIVEKHDY